MTDKELNRIVEQIDRIKGEWVSLISEKLYTLERDQSVPLHELDEELKLQILQRIGWFREDMEMLSRRIKGESRVS